MFIPSVFNMSDPDEMLAFMRTHSFATLVTQGVSGMSATHLPLLFDESAGPQGTLLGHMARANPQWRDVTGEVLVVFQGPHAYISPTWYEAAGTGPTWNYATVHAYGRFALVEDRESLHAILTRLVAVYEQDMPEPWTYDVTDPNMNHLLQGIIGFQIEISRLEGKAKLGQNHSPERRQKVIQSLQRQADEDSQAIAELMRATLM